MGEIMRKALNIATTVVFILVFVFAFLLVGMRLFGLKPYTVLSGSMEPEYHVGSLIYVKDTSAAELEVGMPITYKMGNGVVVTHRIIEVLDDDPLNIRYVTKGDANEDADGTPVHISNVIGRPVFTIPILGYVCHFIQNPPGCFIVVGILLLFVILAFMPDFIKTILESKEGSDSKEEKEENADAEKLVAELEALRAQLAQKDAQLSAQNAVEAQGTPPENTDSQES